MSTIEEKYQAVADHYRETSASHDQDQRAAFTKVDSAYRALTKHEENSLLQPANFTTLMRAFEEKLEDYEKFMKA